MNKRLLALIFILLFSQTLSALIEGRIKGDKIPSLSTSISLEKSDFLYNAPVIRYLNLNFGLTLDRFQDPGLSFGLDWQWIEGKNVAGTLRFDGIFLTNRGFSSIFLGCYLDASVAAGVKISGFKAVLHSLVKANPMAGRDEDPLIALELQLGAYISPHDSFNLFIAPAVGRYFLDLNHFYFNLILSMEIFLWK